MSVAQKKPGTEKVLVGTQLLSLCVGPFDVEGLLCIWTTYLHLYSSFPAYT